MIKNRAVNFLLYGGIDKDDYDAIRPMLWKRNLGSLRITATLATGIGAIFLVVNSAVGSGSQVPYFVLLLSGVLTACLMPLMRRRLKHRELWSLLMCYGQMILIVGYATFLSTQKSNYDVPATSAIVFIALLPLSIDDRPIRMFAVMVVESAIYMVCSHMLKSPHAFSLDAMNVVTFCIVGMVLYAVMSSRSIRELFQSQRIEQMSFQTIQTLANAIDAKDPYTKGHSTRVSRYSVMIAEALGWGKARVNDLRYAALLHDIGKIGVPDSILNKPTRLSEVEFEIIKSHTTMGRDILRERTIIDVAENVAYSHHERYDGGGYPRGLVGKETLDEARIVGIADAFDAMSSDRVYRKACQRDYILRQLTEGRGKQFDPEYVDVLIDLWNRGDLEDSIRSAFETEDRSDTLETSLHQAVENFVHQNADEDLLVADIHHAGSYEGALNVGYDHFAKLYEFIGHLEKRFSHSFKLVLITLEKNAGEDSPGVNLDYAMFYMDRAIRISIRDVDIVTRYNRQQFLVIMIGADLAGVKTAIDRIFKTYFRMNGSNVYLPSYSIVEAEKEHDASIQP